MSSVSRLTFAGSTITLAPGETALDGMLRHGLSAEYSCKGGVCQTCMLMLEGPTSAEDQAAIEAAQDGLSEAQIQQRCVLACQLIPKGDITLSKGASVPSYAARIADLAPLSSSVLRVRLEVMDAAFEFRAGQFVSLVRNEDGLARSYSIANPPSGTPTLELHVRVLPNGRMSQWLASEAKPGLAVTVRGPSGSCTYTPTAQPMLLAGTGTGLAPLYGILQDALAQGHSAPIQLFHGAVDRRGLYLERELARLAAEHANVHYTQAILNEGGPITTVIEQALPDLTNWRAFLCGDPAIVEALQEMAFLNGVRSKEIFADRFLPA